MSAPSRDTVSTPCRVVRWMPRGDCRAIRVDSGSRVYVPRKVGAALGLRPGDEVLARIAPNRPGRRATPWFATFARVTRRGRTGRGGPSA